MERFLIVCGAGAVGCGARYLVTLWAMERFGERFPYGTLIVNLFGSFLIALVLELSIRFASFPPNLRLALTTGFMGGLTTYSAFNYESTAMLSDGQVARGLLNIGFTLIGCLVAGGLGIVVARRFGAG
ncbi:MAG: fluoride efflux transporter CrcB [Deltaproteobacteria bacterium]|nr:fluoride efflux transporter CrcB [Deltaproteobacteria bacterium]